MGRTKKGSLPTYRHHRSSGQAIVTINGSDLYLGVFDTPNCKAEYARVIAEFVTTGTIKKKCDPGDESESIAVVEILNAYWKHARIYYVKTGSRPRNRKPFGK